MMRSIPEPPVPAVTTPDRHADVAVLIVPGACRESPKPVGRRGPPWLAMARI